MNSGVFPRKTSTIHIELLFWSAPVKSSWTDRPLVCRGHSWRKVHCGGLKRQMVNFGSSTPKHPKCLQNKGKPNKTMLSSPHRLATDRCKNCYKRQKKCQKDKCFHFHVATCTCVQLEVVYFEDPQRQDIYKPPSFIRPSPPPPKRVFSGWGGVV